MCFEPRVSRDKMPDLLRQFDALVFPSIWEEPLARMTQEAMATEMIVFGTATGGTGEILIDGKTGLVFEPNDARSLADQIRHLMNRPELRTRLGAAARQMVVEKCEINRMIDEIESELSALC